jgi:hypothetical protein
MQDNILKYFSWQGRIVVFICKSSDLDFCCIFLWWAVFVMIFVDSEGLQVDM